jgi:hypothetical protein
MENPILDFTDPLAKRELLWRAHNAGAIAAARARGLGPVFNFHSDDDDVLVEPTSQPAAPPSPADGLKTPAQAARRLNVSIRTRRRPSLRQRRSRQAA